MNGYPPNAKYDEPRPRKRRHGIRRFFRALFLVVVCLAIAFVAVRFGPRQRDGSSYVGLTMLDRRGQFIE